jgi:hypothetical protein
MIRLLEMQGKTQIGVGEGGDISSLRGQELQFSVTAPDGVVISILKVGDEPTCFSKYL